MRHCSTGPEIEADNQALRPSPTCDHLGCDGIQGSARPRAKRGAGRLPASPPNAEGRPGFICIHVAEQGWPVLFVEHSQPVGGWDSGWGFYCGADGHEDAELRITNLERFKGLDPDLPDLLDTVPEGSVAWRSGKDMPWVVESRAA